MTAKLYDLTERIRQRDENELISETQLTIAALQQMWNWVKRCNEEPDDPKGAA